MNKIMILAALAVIAGSTVASASPVESSSVISATPKKETKKVVFNVGLHCQNCVKKVKENISFEKGVKALEVDLEKKTVTITYDPAKTNEDTLRKAIEKLGYTCNLPSTIACRRTSASKYVFRQSRDRLSTNTLTRSRPNTTPSLGSLPSLPSAVWL